MNTHKFDVEDAKEHGIEKAILLEHLKFHQEANAGNDDMVINGKVHAFIKPATIKKMYPYLNYKSVSRWLRELEEDGIIESTKPQKSSGKHLKYYHVVSISQSEKSISQNESSKKAQNESSSIITNVNNQYENIPELKEVIDYFTKNGYTKESAEKFYNYYQTSVEGTQKRYWRDSNDNKVRNWKQKAQAVWFKPENESKQTGLGDNSKYRRI